MIKLVSRAVSSLSEGLLCKAVTPKLRYASLSVVLACQASIALADEPTDSSNSAVTVQTINVAQADTSGTVPGTSSTPAQSQQNSSRENGTEQTDLQAVIVTARKLRHEKEFESDQTIKVLDQDQIRASSVIGGSAKALAIVPGVSVSSYGATGSQKTTISIDGIKVGWAGFSGGNPDNGSIGVSFDGVPMTNPGNGLWQSTLVPQTSMLQSMAVTYGPGNPEDRWYTNIGGGLNFVPLQPTRNAMGEIQVTYGSFNTKNVAFNLQSGEHGGWSNGAITETGV